MNNPYATQSQTEARIAARIGNDDRFRRALRLDNPNMWGEKRAHHEVVPGDGFIPTPVYAATFHPRVS